jgi:hypothetical protein
MNKVTILPKPGRVLNPRTVVFSDWQVDEAIQIPVLEGLVPIPLWSRGRQRRANCPKISHRRRFPALAALAALVMCMIAGISANASQNVSIAWNASTDPSTTGYIVYAGSSTNYTAQLNVGTNTMVTITGLKEGTTNYFAVSAYNAANVVSSPSTSVSYLVPGKLVMTPVPGATPSLNFPTAPGHWYEIDASTDLKNWTNIYQTATRAFPNPPASPKKALFGHAGGG